MKEVDIHKKQHKKQRRTTTWSLDKYDLNILPDRYTRQADYRIACLYMKVKCPNTNTALLVFGFVSMGRGREPIEKEQN